jgi:O-antigen chain-terminating methyltransferase
VETGAPLEAASAELAANVKPRPRTSKALAAVRARMAASDYRADVPRVASTVSPAASAPAAVAGAAAASPFDADVSGYYLTLESVFRGDPARIRAQLETDYLDLMTSARAEAGDGLCIDVGCGRGEWLDVLRAHGFAARGVDMNAAMASVAREAGHEVIMATPSPCLPTRGRLVLAVTAFHLAEHLDFPTLFRLVRECRRLPETAGL